MCRSSAIFNAKEAALKNLKQKQTSLNLDEEDMQAAEEGGINEKIDLTEE